jgi:addiction module HigA family antidote
LTLENDMAMRSAIHPGEAISADTALRLGAFFGLSAQFWMNLQNEYDLRTAEVEGLGLIRPYKAA